MRTRPLLAAAVAALLLGGLGTPGAATADSATAPPPAPIPAVPELPDLPEPTPGPSGDPWPDAPGANDFSCQPTKEHPRPVILLHGFGANGFVNWYSLAPKLARSGYCVFAPTYGRRTDLPFPLDALGGVVPMQRSARELSGYVDRVLAATGATEVDIVGHSEGGLMPNHYVKFLDGADRVRTYVALAPMWRGTRFFGASEINRLAVAWGLDPLLDSSVDEICGSCRQFLTGSRFLERMNEGGAAVPGVRYTSVLTRHDTTVQPYTSGRLPEGEGSDVTNIVLQERCPADVSGHVAVAYDPVVHRLVRNALDPASAHPPRCP